MALPTMATGFTRDTFVEWCRGIDDGPVLQRLGR